MSSLIISCLVEHCLHYLHELFHTLGCQTVASKQSPRTTYKRENSNNKNVVWLVNKWTLLRKVSWERIPLLQDLLFARNSHSRFFIFVYILKGVGRGGGWRVELYCLVALEGVKSWFMKRVRQMEAMTPPPFFLSFPLWSWSRIMRWTGFWIFLLNA